MASKFERCRGNVTTHRAQRGIGVLCATLLITALIPGSALAQGFGVTFSAAQKTFAPSGVLPPLTGTVTDAVAPTATVTFGDGTSATVPVTPVPGTPGAFSFIIPDHTYTANGNFVLKLNVTDQGVTQHFQTTVQVFGVGSGGGGGGGTGFGQPLISSLPAPPGQIVLRQSVTFTPQISNLPTPDWNWLWQLGFGGAVIIDTGSGSATKTTTQVFSQPGTYFNQFPTATNPPAGPVGLHTRPPPPAPV